MEASKEDKVGYFLIAAAAVGSAFGWFALDRWIPDQEGGTSVLIALLRTLFSLAPAIVGFLIANGRQKSTHKAISKRLQDVRQQLTEFQRIRRIEHELHTMDRLARVAREAVKNTASSAKELFGAIEAVDEPRIKERLVDRYRSHTGNVVTVLSAVSEQMEESGRAIQRELTAEEAVHVLERERQNTTRGVEHAREIMGQRGIAEGFEQLNFATEQASRLQLELSSLKAIAKDSKNEQD